MKLTAEEREVLATFNDADKSWRIYSDSRTMRGKILKLAQQVGADVHRVGSYGLEFTCPADALRLASRRRLALSPEARATRRARALKSLHSLQASEAKKMVLASTRNAN